MEVDLVLESVVRSPTASDALGLCTRLLRQESTGLSAVTALLERLRMGMEEEAGTRTILQGIRGACAPPSAICDQLLQLLPLVSPPTALVEALPQFVGEDPVDIANVVKEYKDLLEGDRSMLVHVIGSLYDLPLGADTRQEVSTMTLEALSVVDEEDVPVVVRTLLKTARERDSAMVVSRVRAECTGLGMTALAVLVDVLADTFSINESVAKTFLAQVSASVASSAAGESRSSFPSSVAGAAGEQGEEMDPLSTLDVVGFLLLLPHRRHVAAVHSLLDKISRRPERLPTDKIVSLAEMSGKPPWTCVASPIRELGLWAAMASPALSRARGSSNASPGPSNSIGGAGNNTNTNSSSSSGAGIDSYSRSSSASSLASLRRAGSRILLAVFRGQPNARAPIVSCCLGVVGTHRLPSRGGRGGAGAGPRGGERDMAADALLGTCLGALDLLLELSENCPDLMSPYANTVGDLVLGGGGRTLHPRLLDKAARCLAVLTRQSNGIGMVNELMNHVQKQVFFLGAGSGGGGGGWGGARGFSGGRQGAGLQAGGHGVGGGLGRSGDPDAERKSAIVLATHLVRGGALEERDEDALLGWAVRLLSLLRGGPSSLHTIALTLELLVTATSGDLCSPGGQGCRSGNGGGGGASSDGSRGVDHRREGWRRAGAAAAGRCLAGIGVLRLEEGGRGVGGDGGGGGGREGVSRWQGRAPPLARNEEELVDVTRALGQEGEEEEEESHIFGGEQGGGGGGGHVVGQRREGGGLTPTMTPSSPAGGATLCVRDMAIAMWREGNTTLSESARSLHSSWFAAIALSCRNATSSAAASSAGGGDTAFHSNGTPASSDQQRIGGGRAATGGTTSAGGARNGDNADARGGGSWLRARLSMPVWPFSDESYGDEGPVEDSGGYWGLGGGTDGRGGGYSLWRIPTAECAWQGKEGTQQLVEAGAACVAARSLLSSAAKYLLAHLSPTGGSQLLPEASANATNNNPRSSGGGGGGDNGYGSRGARRSHADADSSDTGDVADLDGGEASGPGSSSLLSDLVWRYLELGARGRVCVAALRRTARQVAGSGGGGGKGGGSAGVRCAAASTEGEEEEERAATRLEEGLSLELMPLECLCRLVNADVENHVTATSTAAMTISPMTASSLRGEEETSSTSNGHYVEKKDGGCRSAEDPGAATSTTTMGSLMDGVKTPSFVLMAYVELLRTLVTRLESGGARGGVAALEEGGAGGGGPAGVAPGMRALDLETLFRGTVKCSKALPILRKAQAASKTALLAKLTPQKRRRESFAALQNKKKTSVSARRRNGRNSGGGGRAAAAASAETTKRRTRSIDASRGGGSRGTARWLGGDSVRRRGGRAVGGGLRGVMEGGDSESDDEQEEEEEEEEEDEVVFSDENSRDSEWSSSETADDTSEDEDSSSDESNQEADDEPRYPRASTPKGKRRAAAAAAARIAKKTGAGGPWSETPAGSRRAGGASSSVAAGGGRTADGEANPWEGLPGLSLCQFWRYRLLLEVVLAARGGDGGGDERSDGGGWAELPRTEFVEVMKQLAAATSSRPASTAAIDESGGGGGGDDLYGAEDAVFSELSEQHDKAEDGLLAGMVVEVLAALSAGLPRSEEAAVLSWKGLRAVYPRGYGAGYSHVGGVVGGVRRQGASLLSSPVSLRFFLHLHRYGGTTSRLRGQLQFPPHMGNASAMLSRTGLPALPFLQHALLTHWALSGRMGRAWGLAAAVVDMEAFVLGKTGPTCKGSEETASRQQSSSSSARHKATSSSSSWSSSPPTPTPTPVLSQENFDVFIAAVVKLLPASLALASPQKPPAGPPATSVQGGATGSDVTGSVVVYAEGGSRARGPILGVSSSPYEELECLGMVLECLVEACIESLYNGAWNSSAGAEELTALGRLLRRCVLPVALCCSKTLRALESQLERALAWRSSQTLDLKGVRDRGRSAAVPGGSTEGVDFGAARLCRGLLEQCDLCADAVRTLGTAVRSAAFPEEKDGAADAPSALRPHRTVRDRIVKILPGAVLQSDQLSAAVDHARGVLQLPRKAGRDDDDDGMTGDKDEASPGHKLPRPTSKTSSRRGASERLLSRFAAAAAAAGGGEGPRGEVGGMVADTRRGGVVRWKLGGKRLLSLGAELRVSWARVEPFNKGVGRSAASTPFAAAAPTLVAQPSPAAPSTPRTAHSVEWRQRQQGQPHAESPDTATSREAAQVFTQGQIFAGTKVNAVEPSSRVKEATEGGSSAVERAGSGGGGRGPSLFPRDGAGGSSGGRREGAPGDETTGSRMSPGDGSDVHGEGGFEPYEEEEEEEEEEEVDQFRVVGGWGTFS